MKKLIMLIMTIGLVSCGGSSSSGGGGGGKSGPILEDTLTKVYNYFVEADDELVNKLEFFDNDSVKVTRVDGSTETLNGEVQDEGDEEDIDLLLETLCSGTATGTTKYIDIRLTDPNDGNSFAASLGAEVWEGTCNGQEVSCVALVVYDQDVDPETIDPVQGYVFGLNNASGCAEIQTEVEGLIDSLFL